MFALKDIESLKNHASILTIPFFSTAYVIDCALKTIHDPFLGWLKSLDHPLLQFSGLPLWLLAVVAIVAVILILIDKLVVWLDSNTGEFFVMFWVGFTCMAAGFFVFCYFFPKMPTSPLNPFWHIGFLVYGLSLVNRAANSR